MSQVDLKERIVAGCLLAGTGDALGYKNASWEFCRSGQAIYEELQSLGGLDKVVLELPRFMVSDDTVMHKATAEALCSNWKSSEKPWETLFRSLAANYKECMSDMTGRAPGNTCKLGASQLRPDFPNGYVIPFNSHGRGSGAAMRAIPIGLYFHKPDQLDDLVMVAIESGRMTHNNPMGYLGALAVALFASYALQDVPLITWGASLMRVLEDKAIGYIKKTGRDVKENEEAWGEFVQRWTLYLDQRGIKDGKSQPTFPAIFGFPERDAFYKSLNSNRWGGSHGYDGPMIAYDALLGSKDDWKELCYRGVLHGGDSDTTGTIAAGLYGAMFGIKGVPKNLFQELEYGKYLETLGQRIFGETKDV